jgi:polyisoprenoid-binding protein YceI
MKTIQQLAATGLLLFGLAVAQAQSLNVDAQQSNIRWYGQDIIGKTHFGDLKFKTAELSLQDGIVSGGNFVVDMNSLDVVDLSGGGKTRLEGHLKSDDFFSVDKHPEAVLKITQKGKAQGKTQTLVGDLTIKGIKHPVEFTIEVGDNNIATAALTFDRAKYDVRFRSGSFFENLGDKLILDEIKMEVALALKN